jgi:drug/metabolite transporter (DMT)-like permease
VTLTVLLGLASAVCWGAPDVWLAQATRKVGQLATVFGSILIGLAALAPAAFFIDTPDWTTRGVLLAVALGVASAAGYYLGFTAFRDGSVSIVAPIIACEGGVAALFAVAAGEQLSGLIAVFLPVAVVGVALAAMGRGGGKAAVLPAAGAAVIWGAILVLSAPVADDLGVYWGFFLVRASALLAVLPLALRTGDWRRWTGDPWRVAAWGLGDSAAYLLFVAAADRGPVAVASVLAAQFATVAVICGLLSGERLLRRQQVGVALVILGVSGIAAAGGG